MLRALALILALTFAAGTVAHAAQASGMAVEMSAAAMADGSMPDCDGCSGNDEETSKMVCSPACVAPAMAVPGADAEIVAKITSKSILPPAQQVAGHSLAVDPYPPRPYVLI